MIGICYVFVVFVIIIGLLLGVCFRIQEVSKVIVVEDVIEVKLILFYELLDKDKDGIVILVEVDVVVLDWVE